MKFILWIDRKPDISMKTCSVTYFLNILAWMVQESVRLFLCLHWYSLHHLSSKGFPISKKRKKGKIIEIKKTTTTHTNPKAKTKQMQTLAVLPWRKDVTWQECKEGPQPQSCPGSWSWHSPHLITRTEVQGNTIHMGRQRRRKYVLIFSLHSRSRQRQLLYLMLKESKTVLILQLKISNKKWCSL